MDTAKMEVPKIYGAIAKIIGEIGAVTKNHQTQFGSKYNYRRVDDVINALNPMLAKHGVIVIPNVVSRFRENVTTKNDGQARHTILEVEYTLYAEDGSSVKAVVDGEAIDSGDKGSSKALAIAYKYMCFQVFCIPTEEMADPDANVPELAKNVASAAPSGQAPDTPKQEEAPKHKVSRVDLIRLFMSEAERTGVNLPEILKREKASTANFMKTERLEYYIGKMKAQPSKEIQ